MLTYLSSEKVSFDRNEIDDDLINYLDKLVQQELNRILGPTATSDDETKVEGVGKTVIEILRLVQRRLKTEQIAQDKFNLRLLGRLINEQNFEVIIASVYHIRVQTVKYERITYLLYYRMLLRTVMLP
jgi:hypothetical protein